MPIDRKLWNAVIKQHHVSAWPCPGCASDHLTLKRNTLCFEETPESRRRHRGGAWDILDDEYVFSAMLECDTCKQVVSCCGSGGVDFYNGYDANGEYSTEYEDIFIPKYFWPPLVMFAAPEKCPDSVRRQLTLSFQTFFCDLGAAANHIRSCIDEILTDREISRLKQNGRFRSLHDRIDENGSP